MKADKSVTIIKSEQSLKISHKLSWSITVLVSNLCHFESLNWKRWLKNALSLPIFWTILLFSIPITMNYLLFSGCRENYSQQFGAGALDSDSSRIWRNHWEILKIPSNHIPFMIPSSNSPAPLPPSYSPVTLQLLKIMLTWFFNCRRATNTRLI